MIAVGIDKIGFYIPKYYMELSTLAQRDGVEAKKYHEGLGQMRFAVAPHDEDIVTLASNAAFALIDEDDRQAIDSVIVATETGIDQSKSAAVYVHRLLNLSPRCRAVELKQACYSTTAGLQFACSYVAAHPNRKVLLIASDIARYDLHSAAEVTQGCAAVAMVIAANPRIAVWHGLSGIYTEEVMDFWRPNHRHTPLVDGKFSTTVYLRAAQNAFNDYQNQGGLAFSQFSQYCYHLPFTKMGLKTHQRLCRFNHIDYAPDRLLSGMIYNREIGNSYTASLYLSLCSALDHRDDLAEKTLAMFSYGSGCVGEFFALTIAPHYQNMRQKARHQQLLAHRTALSEEQYYQYWHRGDIGATDIEFERYNTAQFRFTGISAAQRQYCAQP